MYNNFPFYNKAHRTLYILHHPYIAYKWHLNECEFHNSTHILGSTRLLYISSCISTSINMHIHSLSMYTQFWVKKKNDTHNYLIHTHSSCTVTDLSVEVLIFFRYHFCIVPEAHNHCQQPHISSKEPSSSYCSYHFLLEKATISVWKAYVTPKNTTTCSQSL
jgi:hypothetical protein